MSTIAEKIVTGERKLPKELEAAGEKAKEASTSTAAGIREQLRLGGLADGAPERAQELAEDWLEGSTYAYSFHPMDDDSVVAVYVEKEGGKVKYEAFESMAATQGWHPVRAPKS